MAQLLRHGREGKILIALDEPTEFAGILLREESLGRLDKQVEVQANRTESDQQDQELVTENPAKGNVIGT